MLDKTFRHNLWPFFKLCRNLHFFLLSLLHTLHTLRSISKHYTGHIIALLWILPLFSITYKMKPSTFSTQPLYSGVWRHPRSWTDFCSHLSLMLECYTIVFVQSSSNLLWVISAMNTWKYFYSSQNILHPHSLIFSVSLRLNSNTTSSIKPG